MNDPNNDYDPLSAFAREAHSTQVARISRYGGTQRENASEMVYAARFVGRGLALVVTELRRIADALERGKKDGDS